MKGMMDGTIAKLESTNQEEGIPVLYTQKSMLQLIHNDTQRIESNKQVVGEFKEMGDRSVFVMTKQLQFKNFLERQSDNALL